MVDYIGMTYRKRWGPRFIDEQILVDGVSDNVAQVINDIWNETLKDVDPEPTKGWQDPAKRMVELFKECLPFLGINGIANFYNDGHLLESKMGRYLDLFEDGPVPLTALGENGSINCVGQTLSMKETIPELADWQVYNSASGPDRLGVHTVLGLTLKDHTLVIDPTAVGSTRICLNDKFRSEYALSEGKTLLIPGEEPKFAYLG
jgi:hypothetical protein